MTSDVQPRPQWRRIVGGFWFQLVLAFTVFGLVLSFVAKPYYIPSASMENTLQARDRVLVNRLAYIGSQPSTGDIVVFDADVSSWDLAPPPPRNPLVTAVRWIGEVTGFGPSSPRTLVKRVVGAPGQAVECCTEAGALIVDDEPVDEPYVVNDFPFEVGVLDCTTTPRSLRCFDEVIVPQDSFLVLGDNRSNSADSALRCRAPAPAETDTGCWRWAPRDGVVGKSAAILWPISRLSGL